MKRAELPLDVVVVVAEASFVARATIFLRGSDPDWVNMERSLATAGTSQRFDGP